MEDHDFELGSEAKKSLADAKKEATEILGVLDTALTNLSSERDEHMDAFEERSERWQVNSRGMRVQEWITKIEELVDKIGDAMEALGEIENSDLEDRP